ALPATARASNGAWSGSTATGPTTRPARPPARSRGGPLRLNPKFCSLNVLACCYACSPWCEGGVMFKSIRIPLVLMSLVALAASTGPASAQDKRQNTPGEFDFYVLSLSWSPSFCEGRDERGGGGRSQQIQCGGRPFSFVVHGL